MARRKKQKHSKYKKSVIARRENQNLTKQNKQGK